MLLFTNIITICTVIYVQQHTIDNGISIGCVEFCNLTIDIYLAILNDSAILIDFLLMIPERYEKEYEGSQKYVDYIRDQLILYPISSYHLLTCQLK